MKLDPFDILLPPVLALIFLALGWTSLRTTAGGRPLSPQMKKGLLYAFLFVLGMGYSMAFVAMFSWPRPLWIVFTVAWALLLTLIAWWKYHFAQRSPSRVFTAIAEGLPALGLLMAIAGGAVEWEYIFTGQGRWWVGFLWVIGIAAMIATAGRNRRTTVIVVLRGIVALFVIGAIAQRTSPALIAAAISGLILLILEKLWHTTSDNHGAPQRKS